MSPEDEVWLAGWLEGEGSFSVGVSHQPKVSGSSTDADSLETVKRIAGGRIYVAKRSKAHYRPTWQWHLWGADAIALMTRLRPRMHQRRREQIDKVLLDYETRPRMGDAIRKIPHEDHEAIWRRIAEGPHGIQNQIAEEYGVTRSLIGLINRSNPDWRDGRRRKRESDSDLGQSVEVGAT